MFKQTYRAETLHEGKLAYGALIVSTGAGSSETSTDNSCSVMRVRTQVSAFRRLKTWLRATMYDPEEDNSESSNRYVNAKRNVSANQDQVTIKKKCPPHWH